MRTSEQGGRLVQTFEGCRLDCYRDANGLETIGIGHKLQPGESYPSGLTHDEALALLEADLARAEAAVQALTHRQLEQFQFDALVDFVFNLGPGRYQASTLRRCVNSGDDDQVPYQLSRWVYAGARVLPGLKLRRAAEAALYAQQVPEGKDKPA